MKLALTIRALLVAQLVIWVLAILSLYTSSRPGAAEFSGLDTIIGLFLGFSALFLITSILFLIYLIKIIKSKETFDTVIAILIILVIASIPAFQLLERWFTIRSLNGSP